jgi:hypothetical protein
VIIEENTKKVAIVGSFEGMGLLEFPGLASPFSVFAALTDAIGVGRIELMVTRLETGELVYSRGQAFHFPDRLNVSNCRFRITDCRFPAPGWYLFGLFADGEWVSQRRLRTYKGGFLS